MSLRVLAQAAAVLAVVGLFALFAISLMVNASGQLQSGRAPDVTLSQFDGKSYRLSTLRGNVVVLNIWASWCEPCKDEAPGLERAWKDYRDRGVFFFGADYVDTDAPALAFLKQFNITYPNGPDLGSNIYRSFRARGVPETYVIDQRGDIAKNYIGPVKETELRALLNDLLAGASK